MCQDEIISRGNSKEMKLRCVTRPTGKQTSKLKPSETGLGETRGTKQPDAIVRKLTTLLIAITLCTASIRNKAIGIEPPDVRPNILLILADDLAWSDLACYGHPWHDTPNLDRLAESGMRFTQGYASAPICSASRASILTGKTTARLGFEFVTKDKPGFQVIDQPTPLRAPPYQLNLDLKHETIAEHLNALNYRTEFFGKWHLNAHHGGYLGWSPTHGPKQQGFQQATQDFGSHPYGWKSNPPPTMDKPGTFANDSLIDQACKSITEFNERPFFKMVSLFHVHTPVKTSCTWLIDKYSDRVPANSKNRERRIRYAGFVETLDHHVGQILDALKLANQEQKTLVLFTSDNGGHPEYTANEPLRGSKWNLYEGGIRVPFLAKWPKVIKPNTTTHYPVIGYDLLPTIVDFAGGAEVESDGKSLRAVLLNKTATLQQQANKLYSSTQKRNLLWHFPYYHPETGYAKAIEKIGVNDFSVSKTHPHSAIRIGKHKLLWFPENDSVELYDLQMDPSESNNLASEQAQISMQLKKVLLQQLIVMKARQAVVKQTLN